MSSPILSASELRRMTDSAATDFSVPPEDMADSWLAWFDKRADRFLTSAARFGYSAATFDLPISIARQMNKPLFRALLKNIRERVPGCTVSIVEEEYEGQTLYKIEVAW